MISKDKVKALLWVLLPQYVMVPILWVRSNSMVTDSISSFGTDLSLSPGGIDVCRGDAVPQGIAFKVKWGPLNSVLPRSAVCLRSHQLRFMSVSIIWRQVLPAPSSSFILL